MTKMDFFRIMIKIFGLYMVISTVFSAIPGNISWIIMDIDLVGIFWILAVVIILFLLFLFLIYKPDKIIGWLKLDRGFDSDDIKIENFNSDNIVKIAVIIIGGFLLIQNIPSFLSHSYFGIKASVQTEFNTGRLIDYGDLTDKFSWLISFINLLIGYLLLTNYTNIGKFLKRKNEKND
ncbi:hypothetical protein [Salinivirga cyanobacteriivorans]